jgi:hypothetical protein
MKKALLSIGTVAIGTMGLFCCYMWMKPGISLIQFVYLLIGSYIIGMPTYDYWYNKLNS